MSAREYIVLKRPVTGYPSAAAARLEAEASAASGGSFVVALALETVAISTTVHFPNPPVTDEELP